MAVQIYIYLLRNVLLDICKIIQNEWKTNSTFIFLQFSVYSERRSIQIHSAAEHIIPGLLQFQYKLDKTELF